MSPLYFFYWRNKIPRYRSRGPGSGGTASPLAFIPQSTSREFGLNDSVLFMNIQFLLAGHPSIPLGLLWLLVFSLVSSLPDPLHPRIHCPANLALPVQRRTPVVPPSSNGDLGNDTGSHPLAYHRRQAPAPPSRPLQPPQLPDRSRAAGKAHPRALYSNLWPKARAAAVMVLHTCLAERHAAGNMHLPFDVDGFRGQMLVEVYRREGKHPPKGGQAAEGRELAVGGLLHRLHGREACQGGGQGGPCRGGEEAEVRRDLIVESR